VLEPRTYGLPEYIHNSFPENFIVAEGVLSLIINGEKRLLHAGESLLVATGNPHKPFNETDSRVVIREGLLTPEYGIPASKQIIKVEHHPLLLLVQFRTDKLYLTEYTFQYMNAGDYKVFYVTHPGLFFLLLTLLGLFFARFLNWMEKL
jgi:hypothetical protein